MPSEINEPGKGWLTNVVNDKMGDSNVDLFSDGRHRVLTPGKENESSENIGDHNKKSTAQ